jgi:hypothetical protein
MSAECIVIAAGAFVAGGSLGAILAAMLVAARSDDDE